MRNKVAKLEVKANLFKDRIKRVLRDNSGQGSVETAIICEPFLWGMEV